MPLKPPQLKWGVEKRLEFIEFRLFWEGGINRAEIMEHFGISVPQASKDLSLYQDIAKGNVEYDKSEKRYFTTAKFKPRLFQPNADQYLFQLRATKNSLISPTDSWAGITPSFDVLPMPRRRIAPKILKSVLGAIQSKQSIEIRYQSMSSPEPRDRWITPHAFAFDGMRWHTRAYCHMRNEFRDFLLPRILSTGEQSDTGENPQEDYVWHKIIKVALKPHPKLTEAQSNAVILDFEMTKKKLFVEMRLALLYYFLKRLNLDFQEDKRDPREQHVVLSEPSKVKNWLDCAQYKTPREALTA